MIRRKKLRIVGSLLLCLALLVVGGGCLLFNSPPVAGFTFVLSQRSTPCEVGFDASASHDPDGIIVKYEWDFGDGSNGTGKAVTHTYTASGTYDVTLVVTDDGARASSSTETITILPPYEPDTGVSALFVASPHSYLVPPLTVQFDASGSSSDHGAVISYMWNFGDGSRGSGRVVLHTYSSAGAYTVILTATDVQGLSDVATQVIQVSADGGITGNMKPGASFTASPTSGEAPLAVSFNASGSSDPDGSITSYSWAFGDGSTGTGVTTSHTYNTPGSHAASLTVIDNQGATGSTTRTIQVTSSGGNAAPAASFAAIPTSGTAPLVIAFDASGSSDPDGSITSYSWAFGDGSTGTGVTTSHTYSAAGEYGATLTVTDDEGSTSSASRTISVATQFGPLNFAGRGPQVTTSFALARGLTTFHMEHAGSANFIVRLLDDQGEWVELLANEIGSFSGSRAIGIDVSGTHLLDIQADGDWTITVEQPTPISAPSPPQTYTGYGQDFSPFFTLAGGLTTFQMQHTGSANFIVRLLDDQGEWVELLGNEIGSFTGNRAIGIDAPGIHLLDIRADGDWTITVEQPTPTSAPSPPQTYTGHGQDFSPFFTLAGGPTAFQMQHTGSANFIVRLLDDQGEWVELLANEIGSFTGNRAIGIDAPGIHLLDIRADGDWTITVEQ